jgi:CRISPR-associated endonuclease/helicase Cas3
MTQPLSLEFVSFFRALWKYDPFPWQQRLAQMVCGGNWPSPIALPTSAGKTAAIDVAIFALACQAPNAPRRIFFVVDRRVVVDEAAERAQKIADMLRAARDQKESSVLRTVADALCAIGGG